MSLTLTVSMIRLEEAVEQFQELLKYESGNAKALYNIGVCFQVRCLFLRSTGQPVDPFMLQELEKEEKAMEFYQRSLTFDANHALTHNNLAEILRSRQEAWFPRACSRNVVISPGRVHP